MNPPPKTRFRRCPECEAEHPPSATRCWLCYRPLCAEDDVLQAEVIGESRAGEVGPQWAGLESLFAWLTVGTAGLVLLFILGALRSDPGLAVVVALLTAPAALSTGMLILLRSADKKPFTWRSTFAMFAGTLSGVALVAVTIFAVVSLMVASFLASVTSVCTICTEPPRQQRPQRTTPGWQSQTDGLDRPHGGQTGRLHRNGLARK